MKWRPFASAPSAAPSSAIFSCAVEWSYAYRFGADPACEKPSIQTGCVIRSDGASIVCGPGPGILKRMALKSGETFASAIACVSEPGPVALALLTIIGVYMRCTMTSSNKGACEWHVGAAPVAYA